jgi:hypothetical protein
VAKEKYTTHANNTHILSILQADDGHLLSYIGDDGVDFSCIGDSP